MMVKSFWEGDRQQKPIRFSAAAADVVALALFFFYFSALVRLIDYIT